ncbi:MAG: amylo-alpha-1,6-glucosidase, partial [Cyanobacteria bacterium J06553_1]
HRSYHGGTRSGQQAKIEQIDGGKLKIELFSDAQALYLSAITAAHTRNFSWTIENTWYNNFALTIEQYRGLNQIDANLYAAKTEVTLQPGETLTIAASTEPEPKPAGQSAKKQRDRQLLDLFGKCNQLSTAPGWVGQSVLAADQFVVDRPLTDNPEGKTIIAGYPWFTDWGRDTMISLPGLTISTGRYEIAKTIIRTFAKYVDRGMLPNVFPDAGATPEYNTVDATFWYFEAIRHYYQATKDLELVEELFPLLGEIIDWHIKGTRYSIQMDDDGLIYAGEAGVQLTWMDAKVGDWVVTPRIGKPIEVNALWYNALVCMVYFAEAIGKSGAKYLQLAEKTRSHFSKFWYAEGGYCYDVIDSPQGNDPSFRPNQIFAVSLPEQNKLSGKPANLLLLPEQQKMVVDQVGQK